MKLKLLFIAALSSCAFAEVTGKGAFPFGSCWLRSPSQLYSNISWANYDTDRRQFWNNWMFEALIQDSAQRGVVPFSR